VLRRVGATFLAAGLLLRPAAATAPAQPAGTMGSVLRGAAPRPFSQAMWRPGARSGSIPSGMAKPASFEMSSSSRGLAASASGVARHGVPVADPYGPMLDSVKVFGAINLLGLVVSLVTGSHLHLDLLGTGAFAIVAFLTRGPDLRSRMSATMVALWAVRLTSFLFYRALKLGHDARLDEVLSNISGTVAFWFISFVWGVVTALPHTLGAGSEAGRRPGLGCAAAAGLVLFAVGMYWETAADLQKWFFKQNPANRGRPCTAGLWGYSQHPNYFGNLCIWSGIFLANFAPLAAAGKARLMLGALSPFFLIALFYGQAAGAITNSVELAAQKYAGDSAYDDYVKKVPLVIPWPS